jgi:hypothetical protein
MIFWIIFQLVTLATFLGVVFYKYGIQPSISDSFYAIEEDTGEGSLWPWTFWLMLICVSIPMMIILPTGLTFLAMAGLWLVGAAARFRDGRTEKFHIAGALTGIAISLTSFCAILGSWYWLAIPVQIAGMLVLKYIKSATKNYTLWIELLAIAIIVVLELIFVL